MSAVMLLELVNIDEFFLAPLTLILDIQFHPFQLFTHDGTKTSHWIVKVNNLSPKIIMKRDVPERKFKNYMTLTEDRLLEVRRYIVLWIMVSIYIHPL